MLLPAVMTAGRPEVWGDPRDGELHVRKSLSAWVTSAGRSSGEKCPAFGTRTRSAAGRRAAICMLTSGASQASCSKLAAAIAHDPELVLLDEPTDGLDPVQRAEMLELIRRIGSEFGMHIVISSHHLEEVERICDAVVIVEGGLVVHAGTLVDLGRGAEGLVIEVDGRAEDLASLLTERGFDVTVDAGVLRLAAADGDHDAVRDAVADLGVGLRRLGAQGRTLEDVYLGSGT